MTRGVQGDPISIQDQCLVLQGVPNRSHQQEATRGQQRLYFLLVTRERLSDITHTVWSVNGDGGMELGGLEKYKINFGGFEVSR